MALITYPNAYPFPYWEPYPTTFLNETIPEAGAHPHHFLHPHWGQRAARHFQHQEDNEVHKPRADVLETTSSFHIDVELPGLQNKADLTLKWLSTRTILVSCTIRRKGVADIGEKLHAKVLNGDSPDTSQKGAASETKKDSTETSNSNGSNPQSTNNTMSSNQEPLHKISPHLTVSERNIGLSTRAFNFPIDVDHEHTTAKLTAGLLTLEVPKKHHEKGSHPEIEVEFDGGQMPLFKDP